MVPPLARLFVGHLARPRHAIYGTSTQQWRSRSRTGSLGSAWTRYLRHFGAPRAPGTCYLRQFSTAMTLSRDNWAVGVRKNATLPRENDNQGLASSIQSTDFRAKWPKLRHLGARNAMGLPKPWYSSRYPIFRRKNVTFPYGKRQPGCRILDTVDGFPGKTTFRTRGPKKLSQARGPTRRTTGPGKELGLVL